MIENERKYELCNVNEETQYLIVAFGSMARISKGAMKLMKDLKIGLFRPITVWPYPYEELKKAAAGVKKVFVFEMNQGQMLDDVKIGLEGSKPVEFFGRAGGGVPMPEELCDFINKNRFDLCTVLAELKKLNFTNRMEGEMQDYLIKKITEYKDSAAFSLDINAQFIYDEISFSEYSEFGYIQKIITK